MDITERFHRLRGAVHITRARTGKDSSMVVWGANVADLTALLDIAEAVPSAYSLARIVKEFDASNVVTYELAKGTAADDEFVEYLNKRLAVANEISALAAAMSKVEEP